MTLLERAAGGCLIFAVGTIGCSVFYFVRGCCSASSSRGCRLAGGVQAVISNAPRVRQAAAWFAVLSAMEGTLYDSNVRGPLNQTLAWGTCNGLFSLRWGKPGAVRSGLKGAAWGAAVGMSVWCLKAAIYAVDKSYR